VSTKVGGGGGAALTDTAYTDSGAPSSIPSSTGAGAATETDDDLDPLATTVDETTGALAVTVTVGGGGT
jgi:hypothetical protein